MRLFTFGIAALLMVACGRAPALRTAAPVSATSGSEPRVAAPPSHLRISGTRFADVEGKPFSWRGISAFRLLQMVAQGRESEAAAYLDWASGRDLTLVRVLTMAHHLFELKPDEGTAALPRLLELAAARNLHVEIVALADTAAIPVDLERHVRAVGEIAARHGNALVEIANEPVHPTQRSEVHEPSRLRTLAASVPAGVPVSFGSIERGEGFAAGSYLTWHVPRTEEPRGWGHVLAIAEGAAFEARWRKPVISDEPIGAAASFQPGRRDNDPARFRAAALMTRLAGLGATFHYEGGLHAEVPAARELECLNAWTEAWRLLPGDIEERGTFGRAGGQGSVAVDYDRGAAAAVFERRTDDEVWIVAVGVTGEPRVRLAPGWRAADTQRFPGVVLMSATREARS